MINLRKKIYTIIKEILRKDMSENVFNVPLNDKNVKIGTINQIERVYPEYHEQTKEFAHPTNIEQKDY